jgi:hypothetical protein
VNTTEWSSARAPRPGVERVIAEIGERSTKDTGQMFGLVRLKDELDEKTAEFAILVRSQLKGTGSVGC